MGRAGVAGPKPCPEHALGLAFRGLAALPPRAVWEAAMPQVCGGGELTADLRGEPARTSAECWLRALQSGAVTQPGVGGGTLSVASCMTVSAHQLWLKWSHKKAQSLAHAGHTPPLNPLSSDPGASFRPALLRQGSARAAGF